MPDNETPEPTAPAAPIARLTAVAASADPLAITKYEPSPADRALAGALLTSAAPDFVSLAQAAGIDRATLYRILADPQRAAWIVGQAKDAARLGRAAVYARVLNMALTSRSSTWARLYLEMCNELKAEQGQAIAVTGNAQFNFLTSMTADELESYVKQKQRQIMGDARG